MRQLKIIEQITDRSAVGLERYLATVSKIPMITQDEDVELSKLIHGDDAYKADEAVKRLAEANLRFVVSVAKQYQNRGQSLLDLISEGNVGLLKAARRFDHSRGFKFISYAVWWIRQTISQAISEQSRMIRLPINKLNAMQKIGREFSKLEQDLERVPSLEELAEVMKISEHDISQSIQNRTKIGSMDSPIGDIDDNNTLNDVVADNDLASRADTKMLRESLTLELGRALSTLSDKEKFVINSYFGINGVQFPKSIIEIAKSIEVSEERARQIKDKAIRRLKVSNRNRALKGYL